MNFYNNEPKYKHGDSPKIGVIIANLGTPDAPDAKSLRKYLGQFLMDRRVVEIPRFIWCWILHCIILVIRPRASAKKYQQIWTSQGSPLLVNAKKQKNLLQKNLKKSIKQPVEVELGMSYGNPSMASAFNKLRAKNCTKILLFPLYPQYAASSSASAMDSLWRVLLRTRNTPEIRTIRNYHDHPAYIEALKHSVLKHWGKFGKPSKLVMSFHGVPFRSLMQGDPYHCECHKTGRLLAQALKLKENQYKICFQSRFGKAEWLKPYFSEVIADLGKAKEANVHVICPGFSSDCLETLEEINMEGMEIFKENGGTKYSYIPALNDNDEWVQAMKEIVCSHMQGWIDPSWSPSKQKKESQTTINQAKKIKSSL